MTDEEIKAAAQQQAKLDEQRKAAREAAKKPEASQPKAKPSTKAPAKVNLSEFDFFTRPQYAVLRSALRRSEAKLVGQRRLDDGTLEYVGLDGEGKIVRRGKIASDVDFPSKAGESK